MAKIKEEVKTYWVEPNELWKKREENDVQVVKLEEALKKIETFRKSFVKNFDNQRASIELALDEKQEWCNKEDRKKLEKCDRLRLQDQSRIFDEVMERFVKMSEQLKKELRGEKRK